MDLTDDQNEEYNLCVLLKYCQNLSRGGLFDTELVDHAVIRDLLIQCRTAISLELENIHKTELEKRIDGCIDRLFPDGQITDKMPTDIEIEAEFRKYADQFDTHSNEWQDMGSNEYFAEGFKRGFNTLKGRYEPK